METPTPSPSPKSPSPSSTGSSWRSRWVQHLSWLISALSGTLEIEAETKRMKEDNERLDRIILQTKNETERLKSETKQIERENEQIRKENDRLAVLESKIDGLFSKYGINSPLARKPEQQ